MKTITFPVGYRPNYLKEFLDSLAKQKVLDEYKIFCSAEKSEECIHILETCGLGINITRKPNSTGQKSHSGAIDNMFLSLKTAFDAGSTFNVHLEDDFLLAPDALDLANWYYNTYKANPLTFISYGLFGFNPRGNDYSALEVVNFFEGLGWCTFKEGWETCFKKNWYNAAIARKYFTAHGWDWNIQAAFKEYKYNALRPLINRTQHNGRIGGTCCTVKHHDEHYVPLKWNETERILEYKIIGESDQTKEWVK